MSRVIAAIALIAVLLVGGGLIAATAYQAGVSTAVTTTVATGATAVTPVVVPAFGVGWHPFGWGFGFFGFLATLFFLVIVFALIRAIVWGGRGRGGPWGGPGWDPDARRARFESRFHGTFDDWHRAAHADTHTESSTE